MENKLVKSAKEIISDKHFAVGNDLIYLPDFKLSLTDLFKKKVYTETEISYCESFDDSALRYASTFAAKEAVYKAIKQIDPKPIGWKKIAISREKTGGKPTVTLPAYYDTFKISLTISHDGDYIWALAFIEINP